ncbi:hypothetical protein M3A96_04385 [Helcobacillus massiliensis]|uniref:hypothetical protein n=1 Tax=Helcobacillus TaxID=1161125 RepID=UPI001EF6243B|nr:MULTISPECIES: hypothetical protein [Helcobacillus]MCG7426817.1 hypothetical protein [Helcobacillus sp. ACRRO]MCT1557357.1 hypothetical protein [Helcobacillus massiliensis]MCT2037099.1 hypothetical protein [Helcobacillus massiliensis]MCT2331642.1 hypothetical protein [Helcobacillus massiliensis]MDK7742070.1 hypothetical protein [Helcobacillus massiliensis]
MNAAEQNPSAPPRLGETNIALTRAAAIGIAVGVVLDLLVIGIAAVGFDRAELWGAVLGTVLALVVTVPTLLTARFATHRGFGALASAVLGSWLVKMIVLIAVLLLVRGSASVSMPWIGIALLAGAVVATVVEISLMMRHTPRLNV